MKKGKDSIPMFDLEKKQRRYYNTIAADYDRHLSDTYALEYRYDLYKKILKGIDLENLNVLDAMCGGGQATGFFLNRNASVTGLDISEEQCAIYKERFPRCDAVCSSMTRTRFHDSTFDFVVTNSLHHLQPHIDEGVREIHRILKPGGYFLLWEPCAGSLFDIFRRMWYRMDKKYFETNERAVHLKRITASFQSQFDPVREKYGGNLAYLFIIGAMPLRINPRYTRYYARPLMALERFFNLLQPPFLSLWVLALLKKRI